MQFFIAIMHGWDELREKCGFVVKIQGFIAFDAAKCRTNQAIPIQI